MKKVPDFVGLADITKTVIQFDPNDPGWQIVGGPIKGRSVAHGRHEDVGRTPIPKPLGVAPIFWTAFMRVRLGFDSIVDSRILLV